MSLHWQGLTVDPRVPPTFKRVIHYAGAFKVRRREKARLQCGAVPVRFKVPSGGIILEGCFDVETSLISWQRAAWPCALLCLLRTPNHFLTIW